VADRKEPVKEIDNGQNTQVLKFNENQVETMNVQGDVAVAESQETIKLDTIIDTDLCILTSEPSIFQQVLNIKEYVINDQDLEKSDKLQDNSGSALVKEEEYPLDSEPNKVF